jgi:hypothetical protein
MSQDHTDEPAEAEASDELFEAGMVVEQTAFVRSAVNLATYIRFSYPLWIRIATIASALLVGAAFFFSVWLVVGTAMDGARRTDLSLGLFLAASASFVGFLVMTIAGHAAESFFRSVRDWQQYVRSTDDQTGA